MLKYLTNLGIKDIIPVLAKEFIIKTKEKYITIYPQNIKKLIKLSFDKCKNSGYPSFKKSLNEKIFDKILKDIHQIYYYNLSYDYKSKMNYYNINTTINSIINILDQIICYYMETKKKGIMNGDIEQNIISFIKKLYTIDEINDIINSNKSYLYDQYNFRKNSIISTYNIYFYEIHHSLSDSTFKRLEDMVIINVIYLLFDKIYSNFNITLKNAFDKTIKNLKKTKTPINIPNKFISLIQNNSDGIYNKIRNFDD